MIPAARGVASTSSILKYELVSEDGRGGRKARVLSCSHIDVKDGVWRDQ